MPKRPLTSSLALIRYMSDSIRGYLSNTELETNSSTQEKLNHLVIRLDVSLHGIHVLPNLMIPNLPLLVGEEQTVKPKVDEPSEIFDLL